MSDISQAEIDAARAAHPHVFQAPLPQRARRWALWAAFAALCLWCLYDFDVTPQRLWGGVERFGRVASFMFPPHVWETREEWLEIAVALGETLSMAFMGTLLGAVIAFPLSFLGAKNITPFWPLRVGMRRGFDAIRAFETLILALIFIRAFGLGPLAGVMAIAVSEIGTFAKLYSEAIEAVSPRPGEGVRASGGSRFQIARFGVMPQVAPVLMSITLYQFESNVRSGTILGIVGAGGIGFYLADRIGAYRWGEAWSIIFLIILMVYLIDGVSARLRKRIIGEWGTR